MTVEVRAKGDGNCMYNAYGISLMYYLRSRKNEVTASGENLVELILKKLSIEDEIQKQLVYYLIDSNGPFAEEDVRGIIEPIFAPAARAFAVKKVKEEYFKDQSSAKVAQAVTYGLEYYFKFMTKIKNPEISKLIINDFKNPTFIDSDVYRVPNIKSRLIYFIGKRKGAIISEYEKLLKNPQANRPELIIQQLLQQEAQIFLNENEYQELNKYFDFISTNWGTIETLQTFHEGLRGENFLRTTEDKVEIIPDIDFSFQIYVNNPQLLADRGQVLNDAQQARDSILSHEQIDIKLKNINNGHWVSLIPEALYNFEGSPRDTSPEETDGSETNSVQKTVPKPEENLSTKTETTPVPEPEKATVQPNNSDLEPQKSQNSAENTIPAPVASDMIVPALELDNAKANNSTTSPTPKYPIITKDRKLLLLKACQAKREFTEMLQQLSNKIKNFQERLEAAESEHDEELVTKLLASLLTTTELHAFLESESKYYFAHPTEENYNNFHKKANDKIDSSREVLEQHKTPAQFFVNLALAIAGLGVLYLLAICINKLVNNHYLFFRTHSEKLLNGTSETLTHLRPVDIRPF